jgi:hypothetical protein
MNHRDELHLRDILVCSVKVSTSVVVLHVSCCLYLSKCPMLVSSIFVCSIVEQSRLYAGERIRVLAKKIWARHSPLQRLSLPLMVCPRLVLMIAADRCFRQLVMPARRMQLVKKSRNRQHTTPSFGLP